MVENFAECYHHLGSHRESVEPWFAADSAHTEEFDPSYVLTSVKANEAAFDASEPYPPSISDPPSDGILVLVLYPTHLLVFTWSAVYWMQVFRSMRAVASCPPTSSSTRAPPEIPTCDRC